MPDLPTDASDKPTIIKPEAPSALGSDLSKYRKVLLCFEVSLALIMSLSILTGQLRAETNLVTEAAMVAALFAARIALALAQTNFKGKTRIFVTFCEYFPTILLPRFGALDPCALPFILTTLRLRIAPIKQRSAVFIGVLLITLRQMLLCESWTEYGSIANLMFSIFGMSVPLILTLQLINAAEEQSNAAGSPNLSSSVEELKRADVNLSLALNSTDTELTGNLLSKSSETLNQVANNLELTLQESDSAAKPTPKAPADFPSKLFFLDIRAFFFFAGFYLFHAWIVAGNPAGNVAIQALWLLGSVLATWLAANHKPPGKEAFWFCARIFLITLFSIGAFDSLNGDVLLFLTAAELFVVLGTAGGTGPFLLTVAAALVPRGTDQLIPAIASGKFSMQQLGWLYDLNGHCTTASIIALLGGAGFAYAKIRESMTQTAGIGRPADIPETVSSLKIIREAIEDARSKIPQEPESTAQSIKAAKEELGGLLSKLPQ